MEELGLDSNLQVGMDEDVDSEVEREEVPESIEFETSLEVKLGELLHKINSTEFKLCSDGAKEFIKLLKGDVGGELLRLYVQTSPMLSELLDAWKLRQGKPGIWYVFSLISAILSHSDGRYEERGGERTGTSRQLDKFARLIVDEKLDDIYKELSSKEKKCINAALLLMASVVRRGSSLASEVAKKFNFKLPGFPKLAEYNKRQTEKKKNSTRKSFVRFAMSFLEVGKPGLLRWIVKQKEMYSGVFRGLGTDDDETIKCVLRTMRDRVLTKESSLPPGLRSVLFGSVTLEQLVDICGRDDGGSERDDGESTSELAYSVLVIVCTDPYNGLMPDLRRQPNPLKGNPTRLLGVMKKLKATEIGYHRDLLLAILRGRPSLAATYMDEFPYNLEDHASATWFDAVSLAADLVSSVGVGRTFSFLDASSHNTLSLDSEDVQSVINCICPRPFSRAMFTKGLLHSDLLVKHGTLHLLWEVLKLLDSFLSSLSPSSSSDNQLLQGWTSLLLEIQNEVRILLPDPQVFLSLLSSLSSQTKTRESCSKRKLDLEKSSEHSSKSSKKRKMQISNTDVDINVSGMTSTLDISLPADLLGGETQAVDEPDEEKKFLNVISEIWISPITTLKDAETYLHSRLLDTLKIYLRSVPSTLEGSFDFFLNLMSNPLSLAVDLQLSLLSLLTEYVGWSIRNEVPIKTPPSMYKQLQPFIQLLIFSTSNDIMDQAFNLARAAMLSTGAFDKNPSEISAWFLFLPGYGRNKMSLKDHEMEVLQSVSPIVTSFICDAISTIGNNLFKYWGIVRDFVSRSKDLKGLSLHFSPLVVCVLQKCLKVLSSESGNFSLYEKLMISFYVCNTLKFLLQTQIDARILSELIESVLSEGLQSRPMVYDSGDFLCEWMPLNNLLQFSQSILHQKTSCLLSVDRKVMPAESSFASVLGEVKKLLSEPGGELTGVVKALHSAMSCAGPDEILKNFPLNITIYQQLLGTVGSPLSSIIFSEQNFMAHLSILWPDVFLPGLKMALSMIHPEQNDEVPLNRVLFAEEMICDINPDEIRTAAVAFSSFLKEAPFHMLLPAILSVDVLQLSKASIIQDFLLAKLSDQRYGSHTFLLQNLHLVLFWFYQVQSIYKTTLLAELEDLSQICMVLVKKILSKLLDLKPDIEGQGQAVVPLSAVTIGKVAETIFCHPAVISVISCPLTSNEKLTMADLGNNMETFLAFCRQRVHKLNHHVLDVVATTMDFLLSQQCLVLQDAANKAWVKSFSALSQRMFRELRSKFNLCIAGDDFMALLPAFYTISVFIQFISPFELLEVVHWVFDRVNLNELDVKSCNMVATLSVSFCITDGAFETLSTYLQQSVAKKTFYDLLWEKKEKTFDAGLIEHIYVRLCKFSCDFEMHFADVCLLKALAALNGKKKFHLSDHPSSTVMSRILASTPIQIVSHCIFKTSMTKAKLLLALIEISPLHMSVFGQVFMSTLNRCNAQGDLMADATCSSISDEDFMILLPAALSYLSTSLLKFGKQCFKQIANIASFYSGILLNGFLRWENFVSGYSFAEEFEKSPSSTEDLFHLIEGSLLGKAICMLRFHFSLNGDSFKMKKRLELFDSVLPSSAAHEEMLNCNVQEMRLHSANKSLNLINKVVAKVSLCRVLLFSEDDQYQSLSKEAGTLGDFSLKKRTCKLDSLRMRFVQFLVGTWQLVVKRLPLVGSDSVCVAGKTDDCFWLWKHLENFILQSIFELTKMMQSYLIELESIQFLEQLMKSALLYRFEDPMTMRMLRHILALLSEGRLLDDVYIQLLLSHSQFAPIICSISKSTSLGAGSFFRSSSSILRFLVSPYITPNAYNGEGDKEATELHEKHLEIIKLLMTLLKSSSINSSKKDAGINLGELHSLLLFSYGATLSDIDVELYNLMKKIELTDESTSEKTSEVDYLWGSAALKIRKERDLELDSPDSVITASEAVEERRRIQFRENLQVDPKVCAMTSLYFPYERTSSSLNELQADNIKNVNKKCSFDVGNIVRYDPDFILHFSIHSLSRGYIEPAEFVGLGLLAVAIVSMSSPDLGLRKLGYETVGRFESELKKYQKKKDLMLLHFLLLSMQNETPNPWQKIPSVVALFAAEASLILLDPSHDHYTVLSESLKDSSWVNMKKIPLFDKFFRSSSINFRKERLWILRLVYAGINLDDDARIYIEDSIIESLMSFYSSSYADNESKELILEIVKKSVKLHDMAHHLVEHCGLLSWLSSILSVNSEVLLGDERKFFFVQLRLVIEIANTVVSSKNITEWLQEFALEPLTELSSHLFKLIWSMKLAMENASLVDPILVIITSALTLSQKRAADQPHFTLPLESFIQVYLSANANSKYTVNAVLGLKAILMSVAPIDIFHLSREKLSGFLSWAVSTALESEPRRMPQYSLNHTLQEESLTSKLLRWLVASVIQYNLPRQLNDFSAKFPKGPKPATLQSLLGFVERRHKETDKRQFDSYDILTANIYHLHLHLGVKCRLLPSVSSALCLILFSGPDSVLDLRTSIMSLCSTIRCPPEANPSWRWSFFEPWNENEQSSELTELERIDEIHSCQTLSAIIPNIVGKKPIDLHVLSIQDAFKWEKSIIETD